MKRVLLAMCAIILVAGCVSNKSLNADRDKISMLETRQNTQDTELEVLRKEILSERKNIESLSVKLIGITNEVQTLAVLQKQIDDQNADLLFLLSELASFRTVLTELGDFNDNLEKRIAELRIAGSTEPATLPKLGDTDLRATLAALEKASADNAKAYAELREELDFLIEDTDHNFDAYGEYLAEIKETKNVAAFDGDKLTPKNIERLDYLSSKFQADLNDLRAMVYGMQGKDFASMDDPEMRATAQTGLNQQLIDLEAGLTEKIIAESETRQDYMEILSNRMSEVEMDMDYYLEIEREERDIMLADINDKLDIIQIEIKLIKSESKDTTTAVRGDLESMRRRVESVNTQIVGVTTDLEAVIVKEKAAALRKRNLAVNSSYQAALALYNKKNHEKSIVMFEDFVLTYPDHDLTANAYYWIGENYYAAGNFDKALREFQRVANQYPAHSKSADAKLKIGLCYYQLKDNYSANNQLSQLKANYPDYGRMDIVDKYLRLTAN
ncbi:MAG: tol-pal system protein YbgF [Candidatus Cloacimonadaceae bacterium]|nr:tol-pal system protein YbgF [Candidatus Cloacimonadaceae bacterium]